LHIVLTSSRPSVSTHIAALRNLFSKAPEGELGAQFQKILKGEKPLVVTVHSADIMATLIELKKEIEVQHKAKIQLTFSGASEAHLLAKEIGEAGIGVILIPVHPFPVTWKSRRVLPGSPLTQESAVMALLTHNVTLGIGIDEQWSARNTRFDIGWISLDTLIPESEALALASVNLERLLGLHNNVTDLIAVEKGTIFDFSGKVVGVISPLRGGVDLTS